MNDLAMAAEEARFLLGRGYPRERVLGLVGDRRGLGEVERRLLRRGVLAPDLAAARRARRVGLAAVRGRSVAVDAHNVIITLETALAGGRLVLADDGWVRDVSQVGRHHRPGERTWRAAGMAVGALAAAGAASAWFWLDAPLPRSGELATRLRELLARADLAGGAAAVAVPERELAAHAGPVAGSDGAVIDEAAEAVDLAGEIIAGLGGINLEDFTT